jgi:hypothetical protein
VPTSPTTGATRRSSGLAPVSSTAEPPPPPRDLSGALLLPEKPQSSYPPQCVALAVVPDSPRCWPTPESGRPPPPCSRRCSLPCLRVGRSNTGTGSRPVLCQRAASLPRARAGPARPWVTCAVHTGRAGAVDVGHALLCNWAERGFGPVAFDYIFIFFEYIQFLANSKICLGFI